MILWGEPEWMYMQPAHHCHWKVTQTQPIDLQSKNCGWSSLTGTPHMVQHTIYPAGHEHELMKALNLAVFICHAIAPNHWRGWSMSNFITGTYCESDLKRYRWQKQMKALSLSLLPCCRWLGLSGAVFFWGMFVLSTESQNTYGKSTH